jgi:ABC-type phosphate transport system auxiliary subunit
MAIIALNQQVTIHKAAKKGELDKWGNPLILEPIKLAARIDEGSFIFKDDKGNEIVARTKILLDKLADVWYDDELEFEDELGRKTRRKPSTISVKRDMSSKPLLTEVIL